MKKCREVCCWLFDEVWWWTEKEKEGSGTVEAINFQLGGAEFMGALGRKPIPLQSQCGRRWGNSPNLDTRWSSTLAAAANWGNFGFFFGPFFFFLRAHTSESSANEPHNSSIPAPSKFAYSL